MPLVAKPTPEIIAYLEAKKLHGHLLLRAAANNGDGKEYALPLCPLSPCPGMVT